jgi:hypothetical protein
MRTKQRGVKPVIVVAIRVIGVTIGSWRRSPGCGYFRRYCVGLLLSAFYQGF